MMWMRVCVVGTAKMVSLVFSRSYTYSHTQDLRYATSQGEFCGATANLLNQWATANKRCLRVCVHARRPAIVLLSLLLLRAAWTSTRNCACAVTRSACADKVLHVCGDGQCVCCRLQGAITCGLTRATHGVVCACVQVFGCAWQSLLCGLASDAQEVEHVHACIHLGRPLSSCLNVYRRDGSLVWMQVLHSRMPLSLCVYAC
jgi:hypothetical protein